MVGDPFNSFAAYLSLAAVVTLTPGPNMALVVRTALESNAAAGIRATLGVASGLAMWAVASALGVAALLQASPQAFSVLQAAGGIWLLYLGFRGFRAPAETASDDGAALPGRRDFRAGLVTNLLNPLVGAFYVAALPGFVPAGPMAPVAALLLAAVHIGMVLSWLSICSVLIARGASVFERPAARQFMRRASAIALTAFGVRVLVVVALAS